MAERIVITGAGVVSAIGAGVAEFERALFDGVSGVGASARFADAVATAEVRDFRAETWLGNKGIRVLDRSARLLCVAARMALDGSGLATDGEAEGDAEGDAGLGLVCGTMFGGLHSIVSFDWSGLVDGPSYVSPMEFANTVINSPAGQAAIRFRLRGVNSTVCAGLASGLYAIDYAASSLRFARARVLLAGGVDELCEESELGFRRAGVTTSAGVVRPFGDASGTVLGEGAALLVLETAGSASARGAEPWAEVAGFGCAHDAHDIAAYDDRAAGASVAIEQALVAAGIEPAQVGCIIAAANGGRGDKMEARALATVFGDRLPHIAVSAPKASLGEGMGASGALGALAGALALRRRMAPPTAGFAGTEEPLRLSATAQPFEGEFVLVNAFHCDGNNAALVLRRWAA